MLKTDRKMKKILLTAIVLAFVSGPAMSQDKGRFELGVVIAPEMTFSQLADPELSSSSVESAPKAGYGIVAGLDVEYKVTEHFGFRLGGLLNVKNYRYEISNLLFGTSFDPQTGEVRPVTIRDDARATFITIPVRVFYGMGPSWKIFAGANFHKSIYEGRRREVINPAGEEELLGRIDSETEPSAFSPVIGFGKRFNLEKVAFEILPYIETTTNRIEVPVFRKSGNQFNAGLGLSLRMR